MDGYGESDGELEVISDHSRKTVLTRTLSRVTPKFSVFSVSKILQNHEVVVETIQYEHMPHKNISK